MKIKRNVLALILGLLAVSVHVSVLAEGLVLTAPPRETPAKGMKMYGPIAAHLSKTLGVIVTYSHPGNWLKYQRDMRNDKYDILFDGPHFVAWRIAHLGHEALIKLPGKLQFILVNEKANELAHADNLIGKRICGISPPNLSSLSVLDYYRNPVRQPVLKGVKGGMGKVYKKFKDQKGRCDAAIFRTAFFKKKLKKEQRATMKVLFKSKAMPNQAFSVSKRVSQRMKSKITNELTLTKAGIASTKGLRKRFAGKAKSFIPSKPKEFEGYNMLLEGVIFGW